LGGINLESLVLQVFAILLGASVGSFLNVVIYRLPAGLSLVFPPSRCPKCHKQLSPRDNIPIVGWLLIKGKCRYCRASVSWRYPLIEFITAILFWLVALAFGTSQHLVISILYCLFLAWLLALAIIDIDTMTLPNALTQSCLGLGIVYHLINAAIAGDSRITWGSQLVASITGAVVGIWLLDIMRLCGRIFLQKEAMGAGDAKLAAAMGAWLGWQNLLLAVLVAAAVGSVVGLGAIAIGRLGQKQAFPFGPFLALGGATSLFFGDKILTVYLGWFGIS
jgi:leader peptidase (prepilin peptidase)/N-methyltransferase